VDEEVARNNDENKIKQQTKKTKSQFTAFFVTYYKRGLNLIIYNL